MNFGLIGGGLIEIWGNLGTFCNQDIPCTEGKKPGTAINIP